MTMIGANYFMKDIIQGMILIVAVGSISIIRRSAARSIG
jgi:hypothetical protein